MKQAPSVLEQRVIDEISEGRTHFVLKHEVTMDVWGSDTVAEDTAHWNVEIQAWLINDDLATAEVVPVAAAEVTSIFNIRVGKSQELYDTMSDTLIDPNVVDALLNGGDDGMFIPWHMRQADTLEKNQLLVLNDVTFRPAFADQPAVVRRAALEGIRGIAHGPAGAAAASLVTDPSGWTSHDVVDVDLLEELTSTFSFLIWDENDTVLVAANPPEDDGEHDRLLDGLVAAIESGGFGAAFDASDESRQRMLAKGFDFDAADVPFPERMRALEAAEAESALSRLTPIGSQLDRAREHMVAFAKLLEVGDRRGMITMANSIERTPASPHEPSSRGVIGTSLRSIDTWMKGSDLDPALIAPIVMTSHIEAELSSLSQSMVNLGRSGRALESVGHFLHETPFPTVVRASLAASGRVMLTEKRDDETIEQVAERLFAKVGDESLPDVEA